MNSNLSRPEILTEFSNIVAKSLHIDAATVTPTAFLNDLGAESLDLIEITMETEETFNLWISEKSILQTATEVFGPNVLERDGLLTEAGKTLILYRMPDLEPASLQGDVPVAEISKQFLRVDAWVRMIDGLLAQTPQTCPQCATGLGKAIAFKMKCAQCGTETPLPCAEELNKQWATEFRDRYFLAAPRAEAAAS